MFNALKTFLLVAGLAAAPVYAADAPPAEQKPAPVKDTDNLYVGTGLFNDMLNVNLEAVTGWGNFMLRFGRFKDINTGSATNISWRKPLEGSARESGYYIGVFAGQVVGDALDGETFQRVGGGGELGYHWVNDYTRTEITVGIGAAEPEDMGGKRKLEAEPTVFFSFNMALGY